MALQVKMLICNICTSYSNVRKKVPVYYMDVLGLYLDRYKVGYVGNITTAGEEEYHLILRVAYGCGLYS